jgi:hypothetical protein
MARCSYFFTPEFVEEFLNVGINAIQVTAATDASALRDLSTR